MRIKIHTTPARLMPSPCGLLSTHYTEFPHGEFAFLPPSTPGGGAGSPPVDPAGSVPGTMPLLASQPVWPVQPAAV